MRKIFKISGTIHGDIHVSVDSNKKCQLFHREHKVAYGPKFGVEAILKDRHSWVQKHFTGHPDKIYDLMKIAQPAVKRAKTETDDVLNFISPDVIEKELLKYISRDELFEWLFKNKENFSKYKTIALKIIKVDLRVFIDKGKLIPKGKLFGIEVDSTEVINLNVTGVDMKLLDNEEKNSIIDNFTSVKNVTIDEDTDYDALFKNSLLAQSDDVSLDKMAIVASGFIYKKYNWSFPFKRLLIKGLVTGEFIVPAGTKSVKVFDAGLNSAYLHTSYNSFDTETSIILNDDLEELEFRGIKQINYNGLYLKRLVTEGPHLFVGKLETSKLEYLHTYPDIIEAVNYGGLPSLTVNFSILKYLKFKGVSADVQISAPLLEYADVSEMTDTFEEVRIDFSNCPNLKKVYNLFMDHFDDELYPANTITEYHAKEFVPKGERVFVTPLVEVDTFKIMWHQNTALTRFVIDNGFNGLYEEKKYVEKLIKVFPSLTYVEIGNVVYYPPMEIETDKIPKGKQEEGVIKVTPQRPKAYVPPEKPLTQKKDTVSVKKFIPNVVIDYLKNVVDTVGQDFSKIENMTVYDAETSMKDVNNNVIHKEIEDLLKDYQIVNNLLPDDYDKYIDTVRIISLLPKNLPSLFITALKRIIQMPNDKVQYERYLSDPIIAKYMYYKYTYILEALSFYFELKDPEYFEVFSDSKVKVEDFYDDIPLIDTARLITFAGVNLEMILNINSEAQQIYEKFHTSDDDIFVFVGDQLYWHAHILRNRFIDNARVVHIPVTGALYTQPKKREKISKYNVTPNRREGFISFFKNAISFSKDELRPSTSIKKYELNQKTKIWLVSANGKYSSTLDSLQLEISAMSPELDSAENFERVSVEKVNPNSNNPNDWSEMITVKIGRIVLGRTQVHHSKVVTRKYFDESSAEIGIPGPREFPPVLWQIPFNQFVLFRSEYDEELIRFFNTQYERALGVMISDKAMATDPDAISIFPDMQDEPQEKPKEWDVFDFF